MEKLFNVLNKSVPGLSYAKVFLAAFIAIIFLIVPAFVATVIQESIELSAITSQITQRARVAGVSTTLEKSSSEIFLPILNTSINLNSQSGLFIIVGFILFAIAFILVIFLLLQKDPKHRKFKY